MKVKFCDKMNNKSISENQYLLDTFFLERKSFYWAGVYPIPADVKRTRLILTARPVLFVMMYITAVWLLVTEVIFLINEFKRDYTAFIESNTFVLVATQAGFVFKLTNLPFYQKTLKNIEELLANSELFRADDKFKEYYKSLRFYLKVYHYNVITITIGLMIHPLIDPGYPRRLVVPVFSFWDIHQSVFNYCACYILQCLSLGFSMIVNIGVDTFFGTLTILISGQLQYLKNNLKTMDFGGDSDETRREFYKNVKLHLEIVRFTDMVEEIFCFLILFQSAMSTSGICFIAYSMSITPVKSINMVRLVFYGLCMLLQLAAFCIYGQNIITFSSELSESLYLSNWYESDVALRKSIIIFMESVKRPLELTAGKFFPLSRFTYMQILKSSYSFFAFLQRPTVE